MIYLFVAGLAVVLLWIYVAHGLVEYIQSEQVWNDEWWEE